MKKTTNTAKRRGPRDHKWLKIGIFVVSVTSTVAGAQLLGWEDAGAADAAPVAASQPVAGLTQPQAQRGAGSLAPSVAGTTLELPPIPTVVAAPVRSSVPRPVARSRSSR